MDLDHGVHLISKHLLGRKHVTSEQSGFGNCLTVFLLCTHHPGHLFHFTLFISISTSDNFKPWQPEVTEPDLQPNSQKSGVHIQQEWGIQVKVQAMLTIEWNASKFWSWSWAITSSSAHKHSSDRDWLLR